MHEPTAGPRLLALDCATETLHLALVHGEHTRLVEAAGGARASAALLPAVQALLADAGLALPDLDAIAFGRGPGAFTGLRTAAAVAQGLAFGAGRPVLALDTLMATAEDARQQGADARCVLVAHDARMGEVYAAAYAWADGSWAERMAPALMSPADWLALAYPARGAFALAPLPLPSATSLQGLPAAPTSSSTLPALAVTALAGNALVALPELAAAAGLGLGLWPQAAPGGAALAALARQAWAAGAAQPPEAALPLYVRDKVAFTTAEREARTAAPR